MFVVKNATKALQFFLERLHLPLSRPLGQSVSRRCSAVDKDR